MSSWQISRELTGLPTQMSSLLAPSWCLSSSLLSNHLSFTEHLERALRSSCSFLLPGKTVLSVDLLRSFCYDFFTLIASDYRVSLRGFEAFFSPFIWIPCSFCSRPQSTSTALPSQASTGRHPWISDRRTCASQGPLTTIAADTFLTLSSSYTATI